VNAVESGTVAVPEIWGMDVHAAKLQYFKGLPVHANSFLTKKDWAWRAAAHCQRTDHNQGESDRQHDAAE
jgi:hypothetical protein